MNVSGAEPMALLRRFGKVPELACAGKVGELSVRRSSAVGPGLAGAGSAGAADRLLGAEAAAELPGDALAGPMYQLVGPCSVWRLHRQRWAQRPAGSAG